MSDASAPTRPDGARLALWNWFCEITMPVTGTTGLKMEMPVGTVVPGSLWGAKHSEEMAGESRVL